VIGLCSFTALQRTSGKFLYGFAKNERENIGEDELKTLREIGAAWLEAKTAQLEHAMKESVLQEASYGEKG
jgi:hypothetical protein